MRALLTLGFVFIVFASQAVWVTFSPVLTFAAEEIGVSVELLGLLAVTYHIFFLLLTIPSGLLLDRDFKRWFLFGSVATFFAAAGRFVGFNYYWLLVCQLSGALGQPFLLNAFVPYVSQLYEERRTAVISVLSLSMYLGTVFALAAGLKLYTIGGLKMLIMPAALMAVLGILLIFVSIRGVEFRKAEKFAVKQFGGVLRRKDLWIIGAVLGFGVATFDNLATWLQPALSSEGLERVAGDAVALAIVLGLIGVAIIPDRIARKNLRTIYMRSITPLIGMFFVILIFAINDVLLFVFLGVSGFLMLPAYAIIMDWIGKFCEKDVHGSATGFVGLTSRAISVALTLGAIYFISSAELYFAYLTLPVMIAFILTLMLPNDLRISQLQNEQR